jgi:hypothetical protein
MPACGEDQGAPGFGRQSSREMNAGRWTGLQRRVRVPSPDEKQGARADGGDDTRAEGGRDLQVARRGLSPRPLIRPAFVFARVFIAPTPALPGGCGAGAEVVGAVIRDGARRGRPESTSQRPGRSRLCSRHHRPPCQGNELFIL